MASAPSLKAVLLGSGLVALAVTASFLHEERPAAEKRPQPLEAPPGWELAGHHIEGYEVSFDEKGGRRGGQALHIASVLPEPPGFAGVARQVDPGPYRGRRLALLADARADAVGGWAGLWMRIDTPEQRSWALDNMQERPLRGTLDWQPYRVVLDVPGHASQIYYGALLYGAGTVWLEGFELSEANPDEPSTEPAASQLRRRGLDFEEGSRQ
jgi:hypothetical protein